MSRSLFRQSDLASALRAARKGGFEPVEVVLTREGEIRLLGRRGALGAGAGDEVSDEITRWMRGHG